MKSYTDNLISSLYYTTDKKIIIYIYIYIDIDISSIYLLIK